MTDFTITVGVYASSDTPGVYLYKPPLYLRLNSIYMNDVCKRGPDGKGESGMLEMKSKEGKGGKRGFKKLGDGGGGYNHKASWMFIIVTVRCRC